MNCCWVLQHQNSSCSWGRVQDWLQHLSKSIQRCCRIGIHVGDVDGLHCINMKLNLSTGFVQVFFFFIASKPMLAVHSKYHTWEIILGGSGERDILQKKIAMIFFIYPTNRRSHFYWLFGFFFCSYCVLKNLGIFILFILFSFLSNRIKYYPHLQRALASLVSGRHG